MNEGAGVIHVEIIKNIEQADVIPRLASAATRCARID